MENPENRPGIYESTLQATESQDNKQKFGVAISFLLELYRVLMGTMLLMFVPQKCGDEACGLTENMSSDKPLMIANNAINAVTLIGFLYLYGVEVYRENKMITYLEVNEEHPTDNDAVGEILVKLPEEKKKQLWILDGTYQKAGYVCMFLFLLNTIFSGYNIYNNYLDDKTTTVFLTNVVFLTGKLVDLNAIVNTEKNVFISAYLTKKLQYNYVDPDKMIEDVPTESNDDTKVEEVVVNTQVNEVV